MAVNYMKRMDALKRRVAEAVASSGLEPEHVIAVLAAQVARTVASTGAEAKQQATAEWTMATLDEIFTGMFGPCSDPAYVKPSLDYGAAPSGPIN